MGRCPHACCYNRTNRWHVHATPPEACELCQRVVVARKGRLRDRWASLVRWPRAVLNRPS